MPGKYSRSDNAIKGCENKSCPIAASLASYSGQHLCFFQSHVLIGSANFLQKQLTTHNPCSGFSWFCTNKFHRGFLPGKGEDSTAAPLSCWYNFICSAGRKNRPQLNSKGGHKQPLKLGQFWDTLKHTRETFGTSFILLFFVTAI